MISSKYRNIDIYNICIKLIKTIILKKKEINIFKNTLKNNILI